MLRCSRCLPKTICWPSWTTTRRTVEMTHRHDGELFERSCSPPWSGPRGMPRRIVADEFGSCPQCQYKAMQWATHECGHDHSRAWRLVLAGLEDNDDAWTFVADEIGDCRRCWEYVARATDLALQWSPRFAVTEFDKAADVAAQAISQELMPDDHLSTPVPLVAASPAVCPAAGLGSRFVERCIACDLGATELAQGGSAWTLAAAGPARITRQALSQATIAPAKDLGADAGSRTMSARSTGIRRDSAKGR